MATRNMASLVEGDWVSTINGGTDSLSNIWSIIPAGDTVQLPAGSVTWTTLVDLLSSNPRSIAIRGNGWVTNRQSGTTYTVLDSDRAGFIAFTNNSGCTITLPAPGSSSGPFAPTFYCNFYNGGSGTVTVVTNGTGTTFTQQTGPNTVTSNLTSITIAAGTFKKFWVTGSRSTGSWVTSNGWTATGAMTIPESGVLGDVTRIIFGSTPANGVFLKMFTAKDGNVFDLSNINFELSTGVPRPNTAAIYLRGLAQCDPVTGLGGGIRLHSIRFSTNEVGVVTSGTTMQLKSTNQVRWLSFTDWMTGVIYHCYLDYPPQVAQSTCALSNIAHSSNPNNVNDAIQRGCYSFNTPFGYGNTFNAITFEDNVIQACMSITDCSDIGNTADGGMRLIARHNSTWGSIGGGHGTGSGSAWGTRAVECNNNFYNMQNQNNVRPSSLRGGGATYYNNAYMLMAFVASPFQGQFERVESGGAILGQADGTNFFDQNHRDSLTANGYSFSPYEANPSDTRLGSVYMRGVGVNITAIGNTKVATLLGLDSGGSALTDKWKSFSFRIDESPNIADTAGGVGYANPVNVPNSFVLASTAGATGTSCTFPPGADPVTDMLFYLAQNSSGVTDGQTTLGSPYVISPMLAHFTSADLGQPISGSGIPVPAYVGVVNPSAVPGLSISKTAVGLSSSPSSNIPINSTITASNVTLTLSSRRYSSLSSINWSLRYIDRVIGLSGEGFVPLLNGQLMKGAGPYTKWNDDQSQRWRTEIASDGLWQWDNIVLNLPATTFSTLDIPVFGLQGSSAIDRLIEGGWHNQVVMNTADGGPVNYSLTTPGGSPNAAQQAGLRVGCPWAAPEERIEWNDPSTDSRKRTRFGGPYYPHPLVSGTAGALGKIISLSGNMDFGSVLTGTTLQRTLTISNTGDTTLTVTSITYPTGYTGAYSGTIVAGASHDVTVTFAPVSQVAYNDTITVNSDATAGTNTIAVTGTGTAPIQTGSPHPERERSGARKVAGIGRRI